MWTIPPTRYLLPNLFTLSATFCGFAVIWMATQAETPGQYYSAAALITLAVFLDGFDGRIARLVDGQSRIGAQLDSLSDFLAFGVAPAFLVFTWGLESYGAIGLILCFVFAACAMIRLARFNVEADTNGGLSRFFTGLPAPMAGLSLVLVVGVHAGVLGRAGLQAAARPSLAIFVFLMAALMVSNIPFRTFKDVRPTWTNRLMIAVIVATVGVVSVTVDYMVAMALGLIGYFVANLTGGILFVTRGARVRMGRDAAALDDDEEEFDD